MNSQSGIVTLNFMVALVIGFGMATILFAMSMTLMVAEVTQYVTFSAARAQAGASISPDLQIKAARDKYNSLVTSTVLAPFYSNGWFTVSDKGSLDVRSGDTGSGGGGQLSFIGEYPAAKGSNREIWTGVRTNFVAKVLSLKLPMIGNTTDSDEGLKARIMTILIREPSQAECQTFMKDRYPKMIGLDPRFSVYSHPKDYLPLEDNGC